MTLSRFANFAVDAGYSNTKADRLPDSFNTTNISFNDTIDLFGKNSYAIDELALRLKEKKALLNIQKEKLFTSLVDMISAYRQMSEQLVLHTEFYAKQQDMLEKLSKLNSLGAVSEMDILRFKNSMTVLKTQIIGEKNEIEKMRKQLRAYTANKPIPMMKEDASLHCTKDQYILTDSNTKLNDIAALQLIKRSKSLSHSSLPLLVAGTSYQKIDDPTANGDNYSFNVSINIPIDSGSFEQSEALRVESLSVKANDIKYKVERENEYIQRVQTLTNAAQQLQTLQQSLDDYIKSETVIQKAFLKKYVDFNTYIQVVSQTLSVKEQIIKMKYVKNRETTILNAIASGVIYE